MDFRQELARYTQRDGLVGTHPDPEIDSTGNGIAYLSASKILVARLGLLEQEDLVAFEMAVDPCEVKIGIFRRSKTKQDQNGWDDYIWLSAASYWMDSDHAKRVLFRYQNFFGVFNNVDPDKFTWQSWFARYVNFKTHLMFCSREEVPLWRKIVLLLTSVFTIKWDSHSMILLWPMLEVASYQSRVGSLAKMIYKWRNSGYWMKQALEEELGPNHPVARYWVQ